MFIFSNDLELLLHKNNTNSNKKYLKFADSCQCDLPQHIDIQFVFLKCLFFLSFVFNQSQCDFTDHQVLMKFSHIFDTFGLSESKRRAVENNIKTLEAGLWLFSIDIFIEDLGQIIMPFYTLFDISLLMRTLLYIFIQNKINYNDFDLWRSWESS